MSGNVGCVLDLLLKIRLLTLNADRDVTEIEVSIFTTGHHNIITVDVVSESSPGTARKAHQVLCYD